MEGESIRKITQQNFVQILLERVPEANDVVDDHFDTYGELLLHLLVADLLRFATQSYHSGRHEEAQRLLAFMDGCLDRADAYVENAIQVSFIENVGADPEETPEFVASWPAGLLAERDRQLKWVPGPEISLEDFLRGFGDDPMDLPDGEITGSSRSDWDAVLDALRITSWRLSFVGDGAAPVPRSAADLPESFAIRVEMRSDLRVNMFDWGTVGFDIDLREITAQVHVNGVISFMRTVGHATRKSVTLSPEGMHGEQTVLAYEYPSDAVVVRQHRS